jgi:hypothetical protein
MSRSVATFGMVCALCTIMFTITACDPGYRLRPVASSEHARSWVQQFTDFSLRAHEVRGLAGESWLDLKLEIFENSKPVKLKSASLQGANRRYPGTIEHRDATVPVGGGAIVIHWDFGRDSPIFQVVGERAEITLEVDSGSHPQTVRIVYERI